MKSKKSSKKVNNPARVLSLFLLLSHYKWLPNQIKRNVNKTQKQFAKPAY